MKTALLIIDVQNDYFPNGKMELINSFNASIQIKNIMWRFREQFMIIIHVQHISIRPGATFFLPDTTGVEFHENVRPIAGEKIIVKNYPNSFRNTDLDDFLKANDISRLVITGMMTHMCIDATVRAAYDLEYECIVVSDCCATKNLKFNDQEISSDNVQNSFLATLNGMFCKVMKKDELDDNINA